MKRSYPKIIRNRKRRIERRLAGRGHVHGRGEGGPVMSASNIHYEMAEKAQGISYGGIGAIHQMLQRFGLIKEIDQHLKLLKLYAPYHESDHVLNIAYNVLLGGMRLEDIELRRNDEVFLNALGTGRIPDPTTAGDFTRRFTPSSIEVLMDCVNVTRKRVWKKRCRKLLKNALIDVDGTLAPTSGECKEGMDISYNGIWGYHPLIVSLANTKEVLYIENRSGNVPSHTGAVKWIDKAIDLVWDHAKTITLRGDTDFSLTENFDRWSDIVDFVFGMDANKSFVKRADELDKACWTVLKRKPKYTLKTEKRETPRRVKEDIVKQRGFENIRLESEHVAEFSYKPTKSKKTYRMVVLRKNLSVEKGENHLFDDIRYFFYVTTRYDLSAAEVVELANGRCDQENVIEQLKNGVNALRMPVDNLVSNWAYMVMAAQAWNFKAWFALMVRFKDRRMDLLKMEFRKFLHAIICLPCQIIRQGHRIIYRLLGYNPWLKDFFSAWEFIKRLKPV